MVGIVMEKYYRTVFNLFSYPFANTVGCGGIFPVERIIGKLENRFSNALSTIGSFGMKRNT